jgi:ferredoxin-NADP reductase
VSHRDEIRVRVAEVTEVADRVKRFRFEPADGERLPYFSGGAHITVMMDEGGRRIRNPYSLISSPFQSDAYEISVLRVNDSRGGSRFMHDRLEPGAELWISHPVNLFPIHQLGRKHILVAGGIGITPFMAMTAQLAAGGRQFELHYAMRDETTGAYADRLKALYGENVALYRTRAGERIQITELLENQPLGTHLYVCGPERMIDGVLEAGRDAGWPEENLHCERFLAPPSGEPFTIRLVRSGLDVRVGEHESMLEAIEAAGVEPNYLCRGGVCGQCETGVVSCDGTIEHNDHYLSPDERSAGGKVMICMSRFRGRELVLDL